MADPAAVLPAGTRVYLPDVGTDDDDTFVAAAVRLRAIGAEPVPHLAARRLPSPAAFETRVARLAAEAGVTDMLVLAGGLPQAAGPYSDSLQLLDTGVLDRHGICRIAVAGHPEGSPDFPDDVAADVLRRKAEFARRTDAQMRIVTQFGFDIPAMLGWAKGLELSGVDLPVHLGLAGPTRMRALLRYARMCGVGPSVNLLARRGGALMRLFAGYDPEPLVQQLEKALDRGTAGPVAQIHLYAFGGPESTAAWLRKRGSWPPAAT